MMPCRLAPGNFCDGNLIAEKLVIAARRAEKRSNTTSILGKYNNVNAEGSLVVSKMPTEVCHQAAGESDANCRRENLPKRERPSTS